MARRRGSWTSGNYDRRTNVRRKPMHIRGGNAAIAQTFEVVDLDRVLMRPIKARGRFRFVLLGLLIAARRFITLVDGSR